MKNLSTNLFSNLEKSILLNRIQIESNSTDVILDCEVYEDGDHYSSEIVISNTTMNQLLNELSFRSFELDFDNGWNEIRRMDGSMLLTMDLSGVNEQPIFIPGYVLPEQIRLLRA